MVLLPGYEWHGNSLRSKPSRGLFQGVKNRSQDLWEQVREADPILGQVAKDWYGPLGLEREFAHIGEKWRHFNAVDAFRHAYTSGMIYRSLGEWAVELATHEADNEDGRMDRSNNFGGVALMRAFREKEGRYPTEAEFAVLVLRAVLKGELVTLKDNGQPGWRQRLIDDLDRRERERDLRDWLDKFDRPPRGEALAPRELERGYRERDLFDRSEPRPGYGDDGSMFA